MTAQALLQWRCMFADAIRTQDREPSVHAFSTIDAEVFKARRQRLSDRNFDLLGLRPAPRPESTAGLKHI